MPQLMLEQIDFLTGAYYERVLKPLPLLAT
jgi:hypothetical protein